MQLAPVAPTTRPDAAKALVAVPMGIVMSATMTAMTRSMGNLSTSRADLVQPLLSKLTVEQATDAMLQAIDGAVAVAPELAPRTEALRAAAAGVAALLVEAAADTVAGDANEALERLTTPLEPLRTPIMEAAALLDPSLVKPQG